MKKDLKKNQMLVFERIKRLDENGNEYWSAREMSKVFGYSEYRHFLPVIERAKEACKNSGQGFEDHFEDFLDMVKIGSSAQRSIEDIKLSRYACYLIVQNADPSKEVIALGQTYFAVQTRLQEITRMKEYSFLIFLPALFR
jgi:DNA-damage-inducible protein D